jgi:hypothetical protein
MRWEPIRAYRAVFWTYSALGVVMLCIVLLLSKACEIEKEPQPTEELDVSSVSTGTAEDTPQEKKTGLFFKFPQFSNKSRRIVAKLCIPFALDSFACSLAPLLVYHPADCCIQLMSP